MGTMSVRRSRYLNCGPNATQLFRDRSLVAWSSKVNIQVASCRSTAEQGVHEKELVGLKVHRREASINLMYMLLYLAGSVISEKVVFCRRSWSAIGLPAFARSGLLSKVRCSELPALDLKSK